MRRFFRAGGRALGTFVPHRDDRRAMGWVGLAGVLLSAALMRLAYPRWDLGWLAWIGMVPIFLVTRDRPPRAAKWLWFLFGLIWSYASVCWFNVTDYVNVMIYPAIVLMAIGFGLYTLLFAWGAIRMRRLGAVSLFLIPMWWVFAFEYLRVFGDLAFPWLYLAHTQHLFPPLIQSASLFGTHALSFLILGVNLILAESLAFALRRSQTPAIRSVALAACVWAALLAVNLLWSMREEARWRPPDDMPTLRVALVQPAWPQPLKLEAQMGLRVDQTAYPELLMARFGEHSPRTPLKSILFEDLLDLMGEISPGDADLVILPESVLIEFAFPLEGGEGLAALADQARRIAAPLVFGANRAAPRPGVEPVRWSDLAIHNTVWVLDSEGILVDHWDKVRLVPFSESAPLIEHIPGLQNFTLGSLILLEPGREIATLAVPLGAGEGLALGAHVCFESTFPSVPRTQARLGAQLLATVTNDAWFLDSAGAPQHWMVQPFRAVENRRWTIQCANTGVSGIVDPLGRLMEQAELGERTILRGEVRLRTDLTLYTRHGDWLAQLFGVLAVVAMALSARRPRRETESEDATS